MQKKGIRFDMILYSSLSKSIRAIWDFIKYYKIRNMEVSKSIKTILDFIRFERNQHLDASNSNASRILPSRFRKLDVKRLRGLERPKCFHKLRGL